MSGIKEINKKNKSRQKFDIFVALVFDFLIQISLLIPPQDFFLYLNSEKRRCEIIERHAQQVNPTRSILLLYRLIIKEHTAYKAVNAVVKLVTQQIDRDDEVYNIYVQIRVNRDEASPIHTF